MTTGELRILVVDDHGVVRDGIVRILQTAGRSWSVDAAASGEEALERLHHHRYDLVVTDMAMPGMSGLDLLHRMHCGWPQMRILVLSMHGESTYAVRALRAGASGYLTKERAGHELVQAVSAIAAGRTWVTRAVAEEAIHQLNEDRAPQGLSRLSQREFEVLRRIVQGQRITVIADELHLSVKTVSTHKRRILDKLALDSTAALVRFGLQHGLGAEPVPT